MLPGEKGMNESKLVDLFEKCIKYYGFKVYSKPKNTSGEKGWDLVIGKSHEKIAIEAKYFKGPKLNNIGSLMISMISDRDDHEKIWWLFNADRHRYGFKRKYYNYEYVIYFIEQIFNKKKYWEPFIREVEQIYIYNNYKKVFYKCPTRNLNNIAKKWQRLIRKYKLGKYFNEPKKREDKTFWFEQEIISQFKFISRKRIK